MRTGVIAGVKSHYDRKRKNILAGGKGSALTKPAIFLSVMVLSVTAGRCWSGDLDQILLKVIGPVSEPQTMACAFAKTSPKLRAAFEKFFDRCVANGTYKALISKYYPSLFQYNPNAF